MHMKTQPRTKMREVPTSRHLCAEHVAMRRLAFYGPLRRVSGKDGCIRVTLDDLRVPSNTYKPPCIRSPGWRFFSRMLESGKLASVSRKARKPKIQPESFWQEVPAFRSSFQKAQVRDVQQKQLEAAKAAGSHRGRCVVPRPRRAGESGSFPRQQRIRWSSLRLWKARPSKRWPASGLCVASRHQAEL